MPRFVILLHETPPLSPRPRHYDLMLERDAPTDATGRAHKGPPSLRTWACAECPVLVPSTMADELADHRPAYLDYEGEISQERGTVRRVAHGTYAQLAQSADRVHARLCGEFASGGPLAGELSLVRDGADPYRWCVSFVSGASAALGPPSEPGT
jgi:hypothetical protein